MEVEQELEIGLEEAWEFFSSPKNLEKITPKEMGFQITGKDPEPMYSGQIISYSVGIFPGIRTNWISEICHVDHLKMFVDEQRFGPYAMWHHEHHFTLREGSVVMKDIVSYKLPLGWMGRILHPVLVAPKLKKIFSHRKLVLDRIFK